jgi:site-specific recombinase XerD
MFTLPNDIAEALSHFRDSTGDVFTIKSVNTQYKKIRELTGVEEFTFHWMRNLAVSALSSMGIESTHLSAMLGHTDAGTLRRYLSLQREQSTSATLQASQILLGGTN